jgi:hypothetical protein
MSTAIIKALGKLRIPAKAPRSLHPGRSLSKATLGDVRAPSGRAGLPQSDILTAQPVTGMDDVERVWLDRIRAGRPQRKHIGPTVDPLIRDRWVNAYWPKVEVNAWRSPADYVWPQMRTKTASTSTRSWMANELVKRASTAWEALTSDDLTLGDHARGIAATGAGAGAAGSIGGLAGLIQGVRGQGDTLKKILVPDFKSIRARFQDPSGASKIVADLARKMMRSGMRGGAIGAGVGAAGTGLATYMMMKNKRKSMFQ